MVVMVSQNQASPSGIGSSPLISVFPAQRDGYDDLFGLLASHRAGLLDSHHRGLVVGGQRRAARVFVVGDLHGVCGDIGHKGPDASLPCPICICNKTPSQRRRTLDMDFVSIQDVSRRSHVRKVAHLFSMQTTLRPGEYDASHMEFATHLSIARAPLVTTDPWQSVPMPLNSGIGVPRRDLRLAVEAVLEEGSWSGWLYADSLSELLCNKIGVPPVSYHGGNFIGRHCHTIARRSDAVCQSRLGCVYDERRAAYLRV